MEIAILSTATADSEAGIALELLSGSLTTQRSVRAKKSLTIDGGQYIDYRGYFPADADMVLRSKFDRETDARLGRLLERHELFTLSTSSGFYTGAIESVMGADGDRTIRFMPNGFSELPDFPLFERPAIEPPELAPDLSIAPGDYATNTINNVWWIGSGGQDCAQTWCTPRWYQFNEGWGRLAATINIVGGVWFMCDPCIFFDVPDGPYSFATFGFTPDYNHGTDPVPVNLDIAYYPHVTFGVEGWVEDGWELEGNNGFSDPSVANTIERYDARIPWIAAEGETYLTDPAGETLNFGPSLTDGGVYLFKFRQTDNLTEYYRDFAELYLHLWR